MGKLTVTADPGTPFIETTRAFAASPELLYRAYTEPDLLVRWLGPRDSGAMTVHEYDVRHGGNWRYTFAGEEGEWGFRGVFHGGRALARDRRHPDLRVRGLARLRLPRDHHV